MLNNIWLPVIYTSCTNWGTAVTSLSFRDGSMDIFHTLGSWEGGGGGWKSPYFIWVKPCLPIYTQQKEEIIKHINVLHWIFVESYISYSTLSMFKGTVTMDTTNATHVHNNKSIISCTQEIPLILKAALHSCNIHWRLWQLVTFLCMREN